MISPRSRARARARPIERATSSSTFWAASSVERVCNSPRVSCMVFVMSAVRAITATSDAAWIALSAISPSVRLPFRRSITLIAAYATNATAPVVSVAATRIAKAVASTGMR